MRLRCRLLFDIDIVIYTHRAGFEFLLLDIHTVVGITGLIFLLESLNESWLM
jgi:hypothetical protein